MPLFDAHLHIIDPAYPLIANQGYLPPYFSVDHYREAIAGLDIQGGAVVSASFQGLDQTCLLAALAVLGPAYVGVAQLPFSVSDAELQRLHVGGVRALRFNWHRGGGVEIAPCLAMARRVHALLGWHVELYVDAVALASCRAVVAQMPVVSIDHLGLSKAGLPDLLWLVEQGVRVKATGFGRVDFDDVMETLRCIDAVDPRALMFGTDLPSTRAPRPFRREDVRLIEEALGAEAARRVCWHNARAFYRLDKAWT